MNTATTLTELTARMDYRGTVPAGHPLGIAENMVWIGVQGWPHYADSIELVRHNDNPDDPRVRVYEGTVHLDRRDTYRVDAALELYREGRGGVHRKIRIAGALFEAFGADCPRPYHLAPDLRAALDYVEREIWVEP